MTTTPTTKHAAIVAEYVANWQARKLELRQAESKLWEKRDEMIDRRVDSADEDEQHELKGWIEQYAIAAETVGEYARLAGRNAYPVVEV